MGQIGNFGSLITFETSYDYQKENERILQPRALKKTVKGRWAKHETIGKKPKKQFLGPDEDSVSFIIVLSARHGVQPRYTMEQIEQHIYSGKHEKLVIGNKQVGSNDYVITEMSESWDEIWNQGELIQVTLELTLEEYT